MCSVQTPFGGVCFWPRMRCHGAGCTPWRFEPTFGSARLARTHRYRRFQPEKVTTLVANWENAPQAFLEDTTKVVVQRSSENT